MNALFKFLDRLFTAIPLRMLAIIGAGIIASAFLAWLIFDLMYGKWSAHAEPERLRYLGWYGFLQIGIIGVVVAALTSQKIKGTGPAGLAFEIESNDPPAAKVTTTTTVETPQKG
jgi:hypothetical protein